jgi:hypothetical protein
MSKEKIFPEDDGNLNIAIYIKDNCIVLDFGKDITWIGLDKPSVHSLINLLSEKLEQLK